MSGFVHQPREHHCNPGWTEYVIAADGPLGITEGSIGLAPPDTGTPDGAVWECDCGRTWVAHYPPTRGSITFVPSFRPEGRFERWRRLRAATTDKDSDT